MQKKWYQKLNKSGFVDAENQGTVNRELKQWHSQYFLLRTTPLQYDARLHYYTEASRWLDSYQFANATEKKIWTLNAEGLKGAEIAEKLKLPYAKVLRIKKALNILFLVSLNDERNGN